VRAAKLSTEGHRAGEELGERLVAAESAGSGASVPITASGPAHGPTPACTVPSVACTVLPGVQSIPQVVPENLPAAFRHKAASSATVAPLANQGLQGMTSLPGLPSLQGLQSLQGLPGAQGLPAMQSAQGVQIFTPTSALSNPAVALADPMLAMAARSGSALAMSMLNNAAVAMMSPPPSRLPAKEVAPMGPRPAAPDPDIVELFDHFNIDPRHMDRFQGIMEKRKDTFAGDMIKLWELCEQARSPEGMFVSKMREMEKGVFIGKTTPDAELLALSKKFKLDDEAESKLSDVLAKYDDERRREYMIELEKHLETSSRPSAMVMMSLKKLGEGLPLGRPGPPAPGCYLDRQQRENRDRSRDRDRGRERDRERDVERDRDRRRDRDRDRERERR